MTQATLEQAATSDVCSVGLEFHELQKAFATVRREMNNRLIEREQEVDCAMVAMIAGEHFLMVGPPGTGKSMLSNAIVQWLSGEKFEILLTKFSMPEEVFGPVSVMGLKNDEYRRIVTGKLPTADIAFIDEIWKASSAILNTLLTALNERRFHNGATVIEIPLQIAIAASNEYPNDQDGQQELGALFDRFLIRKSVQPIQSQTGRERLLWADGLEVKLSQRITAVHLKFARNAARQITWTPKAKLAFEQIITACQKEGVRPGDRRLRKCRFAVQAAAFLAGSQFVETEHLEILQHCLWVEPVEQPETVAQIVGRIANPTGMMVNGLLIECEQVISETDPSDVGQAVAAITKLKEIHTKLGEITNGNGRVSKAMDYIAQQVKSINAKSMENF